MTAGGAGGGGPKQPVFPTKWQCTSMEDRTRLIDIQICTSNNSSSFLSLGLLFVDRLQPGL